MRRIAGLVAATILMTMTLGVLDVVPVQAQTRVQTRFQIRCLHSKFAQVDPIVAPGSPLSAHMHEFFGNESTNEFSTYESMTGQPTTCSAADDTAGYWVPSLVSPMGVEVPATSILIYYRGDEGVTQPFPPNLQMVSRAADQPDANKLRIAFPQCWDGVNLDSMDHISHMVQAARCPESHPVQVPKITIIVRYPVALAGYQLSSDIQLGAPPLTTEHADFWNTWDQAGLEALVDRCLNDPVTECGKIDG